jgi:hypothetical protein
VEDPATIGEADVLLVESDLRRPQPQEPVQTLDELAFAINDTLSASAAMS